MDDNTTPNNLDVKIRDGKIVGVKEPGMSTLGCLIWIAIIGMAIIVMMDDGASEHGLGAGVRTCQNTLLRGYVCDGR